MSNEKIRYFSEITAKDKAENGVVSLAIRPNQPSNYGEGSLSGKQLQERFDRLAGLIIARYNAMARGISSDEALEYFKLPKVDGDYITLPDGKIDVSSFIKNISDGEGNLVVETPYQDVNNGGIDTIKSILAKLFSDLENIATNYATNTALDEHSKDEGEEAHPKIRQLIPDKISEHDATPTAHATIRNQISQEIDGDVNAHNTSSDAHSDIRGSITSGISAHNTSAAAHSDIRDLLSKVSQDLDKLEEVVQRFLTGDDADNSLDQLKEVVAYIKANRDLITTLTEANNKLRDDKIDKANIVTSLNESSPDKVLSAAVGALIVQAISEAIEDKVTNSALAETLKSYVTRTVLDSMLAAYLKKNELGDIIRPEDLVNYIDVNELAAALEPYAKIKDIPDVSNFVDTNALYEALINYVKTTDLPDFSVFVDTNGLNSVLQEYIKRGELDIDSFLTIDDLNGYVKDSEDNPVVRQNDLEEYAKESSDNPIVRETELDGRLESYALSSDLEGVVKDSEDNPVVRQDDLEEALEGFEGGTGSGLNIDGDTLKENDSGNAEVHAIKEVNNNSNLRFFIGTRAEYNALSDKTRVFAIITDEDYMDAVKEAVEYLNLLRNGVAIPRAIADESGNNIEKTYAKASDIIDLQSGDKIVKLAEQASSATKATQDAIGNTIHTTYLRTQDGLRRLYCHSVGISASNSEALMFVNGLIISESDETFSSLDQLKQYIFIRSKGSLYFNNDKQSTTDFQVIFGEDSLEAQSYGNLVTRSTIFYISSSSIAINDTVSTFE